MEQFQNLLKELGASVGLPDLKPSDDGLCSLRFDDRVTIDLECNDETGAIIFSSIVATLLPYQTEKLYPDLLEANLLWAGTGGATLGVDPATLSVFMCYQEKIIGMEFLRFQELLKGFSDVALFWNKRIQEGEDSASSQITAEPGSPTEVTPPAAPVAGSVGTYA
ncbi:MAG: type III secretion system chaperone [Chthoniobacterales bacterium]|nr:type III secretion system chaperone [Chthoniobacterales bacterium]